MREGGGGDVPFERMDHTQLIQGFSDQTKVADAHFLVSVVELTPFLRWLPPVLHFPEPLNFTKGFLAHHDGLVPVLARWCYNGF